MKAKNYMMIFLCGGMLVAGTACKNENAPEDKTVQKRHLTIKMSDDAAGMPIRRIKDATITPEGSTLLAEWTAGDQACWCNLSRQFDGTGGKSAISGTLTAATSGIRTDLNGDVTCTENDYLAVVYPKNIIFVYNDPGTTYSFSIPLLGQNGTLDMLASSFHHVYGRAHVESVTGTTATATMDKMESLLTICKFSFTDGTNPIPVHKLDISYGGAGSDAGNYPQSASVEVSNMTTNTAAQAVAVAGSTPLTIICSSEQNEVYVALLPEMASRTYNFTVTNSSGTYTGTAEAWLKKGEYVVATNLRLTKE